MYGLTITTLKIFLSPTTDHLGVGKTLIRFSNLLATAFILVFSLAADAQETSYWQVSGGVAHTSIMLPEAQKPNTRATLTIEYSIVGGRCRVMVGVAVLSGRAYGTPRGSKKMDYDMTVTILGMHKWTAKPITALYSNGIESAIPASTDLVKELKAGSKVHVHAFPNSPILEFSLRGSRAAIQQASSACR